MHGLTARTAGSLSLIGVLSSACGDDTTASPFGEGPVDSSGADDTTSSGGGGDDGDVTGHDSGPDTGGGTSGFVFDVGMNDTGEGTETGVVLPGSCRASEMYGAAGGYPQFADEAYEDFLDRQVLLMTGNPGVLAWSEYALRVFDISGDPPPPNVQYAAPTYSDPSWTRETFGGGLFGLTLDSAGNVYAAASTVFGNFGNDTITPDTIYRVDGVTGQVTVFATVPNEGPALGNLNYDCVSETIYAVDHDDCRIYQLDMEGDVVSTYHHGSGDVTLGPAGDPDEPDGEFCPLGDRVWAVQSHYGRLYYSVWREDYGRQSATEDNEIWSVAYVDDEGVPDPATARREATIPALDGQIFSSPVSDISFAASGWMLVAQRTMIDDDMTMGQQSTTYELQQVDGEWEVVGTTYVVGESPNSAAGGVDHDFAEGGYVWMTGDSLDVATPDWVFGIQGTPYGGGTVEESTIIDYDGEVSTQNYGVMGDVEIPLPGDASPPPEPAG